MMLIGRNGGVEFDVRVQPRAARSEIVGPAKGALRIRLAAPPVEGAANRELQELLADVLGVPRSSISLLRGERSRSKTIFVAGLDPRGLQKRLRL